MSALMVFAFWSRSAAAQDADFISVPIDKARVYDANHNGMADLNADTWLYDQNDDGRVDLAIAFRPDGKGTAYIYDDANGDGQVSYALKGNDLQVLEPYWRLKVEKRNEDWFLIGGQPNWNLDVTVDSGFEMVDLDAVFALSDQRVTQQWGTTAIDGTPDLIIRFWDTNQDGVPDYEYNSANLAGHLDALVVNKSPDRQIAFKSAFPFLDAILQMDWPQAHISKIRHLIPTRLNEAGYFLYFDRPTVPGAISFAFENPFAFYDLQGDKDGIAELKLRAVTGDYDRQRSQVSVYNEIRYSWAQNGDQPQYRLYVVGNVLNSNIETYPTHQVSLTRYEDLPGFVIKHPWIGAAFAEYESETPRSFSEGIYENLLFTPTLRRFLLDRRISSLPLYLPAYLQLREEYNFDDYQRSPQLYFSQIDRRLHLVAAREGVIIYAAETTGVTNGNFDFTDQELATGELKITRAVKYTDTDNDNYVDTWRRIGDGQPELQLSFRPGILLYAEPSRIRLKLLASNFQPILWESAPPATPVEWETYRDRLSRDAGGRRSLEDLSGIFADMPGEEVTLEGVNLQSLSTQSQRLIMHVTSQGMSLPEQIVTTLPDALPPGDYVVWSDSGRLRMGLPTPPHMQVVSVMLKPSEDTGINAPTGDLEVRLENSGLGDSHVQEVLIQDLTDGLTTRLAHPPVIPALGTQILRWPWYPTSTGEHVLNISIEYTDAAGDLVREQKAFTVRSDASVPVLEESLFAQTQVPALAFITTLLVLSLAIAVWRFTSAQDNGNGEIN